MEFILTPIGLGSEFMNTIRLKASSIDGGDSVVLGRNETTGLNIPTCPNFQFISRNHIELNVRDDSLYMKCVSTQDMVVYLNGVPCDRAERKLEEADMICMLGVRRYFNYKIRCEITLVESPKASSNLNPVLVDLLDSDYPNHKIESAVQQKNHGATTVISMLNNAVVSSHAMNKTQSYGNDPANLDIASVTKKESITVKEAIISDKNSSTITEPITDQNLVKLKPVPSAEDLLKTMINKLLRQYECSICYETLAGAVSLNPCGCCFCYTCIAGWVEDGNKHKSFSSTSIANPFSNTAQCPYCQGDFTLSGVLPNRLVDGAIREILTDLPTELADWERRVKEGAAKRKEVMDSLSTQSSSNSSRMGVTVLTNSSSSSSNNNSSAASHRTGLRGTLNSFFDRTVSPTRPASRTGANSRSVAGGRGLLGTRPMEVVELVDSQPSISRRDALNARKAYLPGSRIDMSLNSDRHAHSPSAAVAVSAGILRGTKRGRNEEINATQTAPANVFDLTSQSLNNPFASSSSSSSSSSNSTTMNNTNNNRESPLKRLLTRNNTVTELSASHMYCCIPIEAKTLFTIKKCEICSLWCNNTPVMIGVMYTTRQSSGSGSRTTLITAANADNLSYWKDNCREWYHPECLKRPNSVHKQLRYDNIHLADKLDLPSTAYIRNVLDK